MSRPYTVEQSFEFELKTQQMASMLVGRVAVPSWAMLDEEALEALLYDALVALREQMAGEGDE